MAIFKKTALIISFILMIAFLLTIIIFGIYFIITRNNDNYFVHTAFIALICIYYLIWKKGRKKKLQANKTKNA